MYPRPELTLVAAHLLSNAERPVIIAGGGVVRSDAAGKLRALAEKIDAPVVTTFGGKGAFPWEHPLSLRSWLEDRYTTDFLESADVLLVVGSGLGELSSNYHTFAPRGRVIQIEADAGKLESNHPALGIHSDAREALADLLEAVEPREDATATERVRELLARVHDRIAAQDLTLEQQVLASVREALPDTSPSFWDMTILAYWAWSAFDARHPNTMHSAQGAGGLGYGFPAALGAAAADRTRPVLAVSGDGGAMYSIAELATARQYDLPVTWLIVDDGGYGILREYMTGAFGEATATELSRPDFVALAESFGVPAVRTSPESLAADLAKALAAPARRSWCSPRCSGCSSRRTCSGRAPQPAAVRFASVSVASTAADTDGPASDDPAAVNAIRKPSPSASKLNVASIARASRASSATVGRVPPISSLETCGCVIPARRASSVCEIPHSARRSWTACPTSYRRAIAARSFSVAGSSAIPWATFLSRAIFQWAWLTITTPSSLPLWCGCTRRAWLRAQPRRALLFAWRVPLPRSPSAASCGRR